MTPDDDAVAQLAQAWASGDGDGVIDSVTPDVVHNVSQGRTQVGVERLADYLRDLARTRRERWKDVVILDGPPGRHAIEFTIYGSYLRSIHGLPVANGQSYVLPAGMFLTARDGLVGRISMFWNQAEWLRQITGEVRVTQTDGGR
ncbi:nuclear transport factor 2 family protein [Jannaschia sp. LMIT008]|uniref:nuclear transport factor 2 family protein n=1 Tax=Jannaschia maritima TaxID=3032585 RepID=UPI002811B411|nr:nuclear transport factor 2 family protein [Jannaschia sp. LMIT008]